MKYDKNISDLPQEKCLVTIKNRPWSIQIGIGILGFLMLIFAGAYRYYGVIFLSLSITSAFATTDYLVCKLYRDKIAVFNPQNQEEFGFVEFSDIISYKVDNKARAFVLLELIGETEEIPIHEVVSTFQAGKLRAKLHKLIPEKEFEKIRMKKLDFSQLTSEEAKEKRRLYKEIKKEQRQQKKAKNNK